MILFKRSENDLFIGSRHVYYLDFFFIFKVFKTAVIFRKYNNNYDDNNNNNNNNNNNYYNNNNNNNYKYNYSTIIQNNNLFQTNYINWSQQFLL